MQSFLSVLQLSNATLGESGLYATLSSIRKSAKQVTCYLEDMQNVDDNQPGLMRLPIALLPKAYLDLELLLFEDKNIQDILYKRVNEKGFNIIFNKDTLKRGILWFRGGAISAKEEQISIFIILPRPKSRGESAQSQEPQSMANQEAVASQEALASQEAVASQEPPSMCVIERPISPGQFVSSSLKCQVGDVIILEGGERLWLRKKGDVELRRDICLLALLYQIEAKN
ncbi:hypothetical protein ACQKWADRAFT_307141 [Trichoderma austrokoningii]